MKKNSYFVVGVLALSMVIGWVIWNFAMGNPANFTDGAGRTHPAGGNILGTMYLGGFLVPILIGLILMIFTFVFERFISLKKAQGKRDLDTFLKQADKHLVEGNIDAVIDLCNQQKGSVANIVRGGAERFRDIRNSTDLTNTQKVAEVKRALEEVTMLETPLLEKNLVILSTIASISTMIGLLGTVFGMIRSFRALGEGGAGASATQLSVGISEALWNTALGIGGGILAIIFYNVLTNKVDKFIYTIDEATLTLVESLENRFLGKV
jgi:biopolymer transport protein ExbB